MKQFIIAICCVAMSACTGGNTTDTKTSLGPAEFDEQSKKTTAEAILLDVRNRGGGFNRIYQRGNQHGLQTARV